jgi:hypothetical protein
MFNIPSDKRLITWTANTPNCLDKTWLMWHFHDVSSVVKPRNFVFLLLVILLYSNVILNLVFNCSLLKVVLFRFRDHKLFLNHTLSAKILFFMRKFYRTRITKLVWSAYSTDLALLAVAVGKSFIYNRKSKGPSTEPCGTACLTSSQRG